MLKKKSYVLLLMLILIYFSFHFGGIKVSKSVLKSVWIHPNEISDHHTHVHTRTCLFKVMSETL